MKWFKCITLNSPEVIEAKKAVGPAGCFQILCVIEEAISQELYKIDVEHVSAWAFIKTDRAAKILPFAQKILSKSQEILGKSQEILGKSQEILGKSQEISKNLEQMSENLEQISENLIDFTPSNPGGSIKEERENRENRENREREKDNTPLPPKGGSSPARRKIIPSDWSPSDKCVLVIKQRHDVDDEEIKYQTSRLVEYCQSSGKTYIDFDAALRNWFSSPFYKAKPSAQAAKSNSQWWDGAI